jgi:hypothetical protein
MRNRKDVKIFFNNKFITSNIIADTCLKHSIIESNLPLTVTALSVELGNISLAT